MNLETLPWDYRQLAGWINRIVAIRMAQALEDAADDQERTRLARDEIPSWLRGRATMIRFRHTPNGRRPNSMDAEAADVEAVPVDAIRILVPLDRRPNPEGARINEGANYADVPVVIDPDLPTLGEYGYTYDYRRVIRLREWNEQVLLHEILHVVLDPLALGTTDDPHAHNIISRVEVALWETGWRISSDDA